MRNTESFFNNILYKIARCFVFFLKLRSRTLLKFKKTCQQNIFDIPHLKLPERKSRKIYTTARNSLVAEYVTLFWEHQHTFQTCGNETRSHFLLPHHPFFVHTQQCILRITMSLLSHLLLKHANYYRLHIFCRSTNLFWDRFTPSCKKSLAWSMWTSLITSYAAIK